MIPLQKQRGRQKCTYFSVFLSYLLRRNAESRAQTVLIGLAGVRMIAVALQPLVEAVVHVLGQSGVFHAELLLQLDGARVLLPQFIAHGRGQGGRVGRFAPEKLLIEAVFPELQQPQFVVVGVAGRVVRLQRTNIHVSIFCGYDSYGQTYC